MIKFPDFCRMEDIPSEVQQILQTLEEHSFLFILTGSQYFGLPHEDSDWDFFVCAEAEQWLKAQGFQMSEGVKHYLHDLNIRGVMNKGKVQVQLVHKPVTKIAAQALLRSLPYPAFRLFLDTPKNEQAQWWNWAMDQVEERIREKCRAAQ